LAKKPAGTQAALPKYQLKPQTQTSVPPHRHGAPLLSNQPAKALIALAVNTNHAKIKGNTPMTEDAQPKILKLVTWPDDYPTGTLIAHLEKPRFIARVYRTGSKITFIPLRFRTEDCPPEKLLEQIAPQLIEIYNQMHPDQAPITACKSTIERTPSSILMPVMFAYHPETNTIVTIDCEKICQITPTPNTTGELFYQKFLERHREIYEQPIPQPQNEAPSQAPSGVPEILINYESDSDYDCFKDRDFQPENHSGWRRYVSDIQQSLKAKSPPSENLDTCQYLLWLHNAQNIGQNLQANKYKTQISFLRTLKKP
jgi:hypothetical protein